MWTARITKRRNVSTASRAGSRGGWLTVGLDVERFCGIGAQIPLRETYSIEASERNAGLSGARGGVILTAETATRQLRSPSWDEPSATSTTCSISATRRSQRTDFVSIGSTGFSATRGASGRRVRLPVDGYWHNANVVVEYRERQHDQPLAHFDKPDRLTVSGVHRGLQRALYDARRDELIPAHGIRLVVITPADLDATPRGRLRRQPDHDLPAIKRLLLSPAEPSAIPQAPQPT